MKRSYCRNIQKEPTLNALRLRQVSCAGCRTVLFPYGGGATCVVPGANELKREGGRYPVVK